MSRFNRVFTSLFCLALLMIPVTGAWAQTEDVSAHPMIGYQAPPFELKTTSGDTLGLEGWKGKFVVIHFGASW